MVFTDIRLQQYRSYTDASFELGPGVNIVVGPNAAGKTNLLEALMVAAIGRSYRGKDPLLAQSGKDWARIDVHTSDNQTRIIKLQDSGAKLTKTYDFDDKTYKRFPAQYKQPVVLFEPNDLSLIHDEPSVRRDYVDDIIEQYTPGYDKLRSTYKRIVSQRNALLKQGSVGTSQLFAWNIRLCDIAAQLVSERLRAIEELNTELSSTYSAIAGKKTNITMRYESKIDLSSYSTSLMKKLESSIELDIARGFTGNGPHRDDIVFYFDDKLVSERASRGEIRTLLLSLKILELTLLELKTTKRPLLLLDDVFSELDGARRKALTEFLKDYQVIITTTDADVVIHNFTASTHIVAI